MFVINRKMAAVLMTTATGFVTNHANAASVFNLEAGSSGTLSGGVYTQTVDGISLTVTADSSAHLIDPVVSRNQNGLGVSHLFDITGQVDGFLRNEALTFSFTPDVLLEKIRFTKVDRNDFVDIFAADISKRITINLPGQNGSNIDVSNELLSGSNFTFTASDINRGGFFSPGTYDGIYDNWRIEKIWVSTAAPDNTAIAPVPAAAAAGLPALLALGMRRRRN